MKQSFSVRNKSLNEFFREHLVFKEGDSSDNFSPYHYMRSEIVLKKSGVASFSQVIFELFDKSYNTGAELVSTYTYDVSEYDDYSVKLSLVAFESRLRDDRENG